MMPSSGTVVLVLLLTPFEVKKASSITKTKGGGGGVTKLRISRPRNQQNLAEPAEPPEPTITRLDEQISVASWW